MKLLSRTSSPLAVRAGGAFMSLAILSTLAVACGGGKNNPTAPGTITGADPTDAEWMQLAAQLSAIAVDGVQQAVAITSSASSNGLVAASGLQGGAANGIPLAAVSWTNQYSCCGSAAGSSTVRVDGQLSGGSSGTVEVTETIDTANTTWAFGTQQSPIQVPAGGLKVTASLSTAGGQFQAVQQFKLVGTFTYGGSSGAQKTATVNLVIGYSSFPTQSSSSQPPTATGQFGTTQINGTTLPSQTTPAPSTPPIVTSTFTGAFSGQLVVGIMSGLTGPSAPTSCSETTALNGVMTIALQQRSDGTVGGNSTTTGTETYTVSCNSGISSGTTVLLAWGGAVSGTAGNLAFSSVSANTAGGVTVTHTTNFSGALANGIISGTVTHSRTQQGANVSGSGGTTMSVTLR